MRIFCYPDHYTILPIHLRVVMYFGGHAPFRVKGDGIEIGGWHDELAGAWQLALENPTTRHITCDQRMLDRTVSLCCSSPLPLTGLYVETVREGCLEGATRPGVELQSHVFASASRAAECNFPNGICVSVPCHAQVASPRSGQWLGIR